MMIDQDGYALRNIATGGIDVVESSDRFFMEYAVRSDSGYSLMDSVIYALYDRKHSNPFPLTKAHYLQLAPQLKIARALQLYDDLAPMYSYVIGGKTGPWDLVELNIFTAEPTGKTARIRAGEDWLPTWRRLGIANLKARAEYRVKFASQNYGF